ncbi:MAG: serine/threonine protein kinase, partial [Pseudobdellovibrionaceae bacterium]|nr:serine/threonine protein kinase [Pseudobdellovibrionaceae bacterium]
NAQTQQHIQRLMEPTLRSGPFTHYVIIDDTYRNISTDTRYSLGRKLDVSTDVMLVVDRQLNGEQVFAPRWQMGTAFRDPELMKRPEFVSWFGSPIRDASGRVVAVLGLAVDVTRTFDVIFRIGRWGNSGETYGFNKRGQMLSESRFSRQLVDIGLLKEGQSSGLNVYLKDPGGDMTKGFRPENPREELPFTRLVSKALTSLRLNPQVTHGYVLEPYRDYRGVEVIGAWQWHPKLELGMITEVNADEALLTKRFIDRAYLTLIILFISVTAFASIAYLDLIRIRPAALLGSRMGQYRLLRKISEGGIGEIYLAKHEFLKRPTAIKILKCDGSDPDSLKRFEAEVRATSQLTHHNTVAIYDFGMLKNGRFYYAMEYLPGISLAKLIELEQRLPYPRVIYLLLQVCGSLQEAHSLGLIHRDIKPLNIMICRLGGVYDVVKVVDFGLVKSIKNLVPSEFTDGLSENLRGTPAYMAPELLTDPLTATPGIDIYSLGVVAYKMLSGINPFDAPHEGALLYDIMHTTPKHLSELRPDLPARLITFVMQSLDKQPKARPPSIEAVATELQSALEGPPWSLQDARRWWSLRDHLLLPAD